MKCPVCKTVDLVMSERSGIEIDYCSSCRGIWLDRGELQKLIERADRSEIGGGQPVQQVAPPPVPQQGVPHPGQQPPYGYRPEMDDSKYGYQYGYKKKKKWWHEIFDD